MVESIIGEDDPFYEKLRQGFSTATTTTNPTTNFGVTELQVCYMFCVIEWTDLMFRLDYSCISQKFVLWNRFHDEKMCVCLNIFKDFVVFYYLKLKKL